MHDLTALTKTGQRVTMVGLVSNIALAASKYWFGIAAGSAALISDACHQLGDIATDVVTLYIVKKARKPADETHPYGHEKYESLGSMLVSLPLVGMGVMSGWYSAVSLMEVWSGAEAAAAVSAGLPVYLALGVSAVSVLCCVLCVVLCVLCCVLCVVCCVLCCEHGADQNKQRQGKF